MKKLLYLFMAVGLSLAVSSCNKCKDVSCENDGECVDGECDCPTGFSGDECEVEDKCVTNNVTCENDGECVDGECDCTAFFYGETCSDYCLNGTYNNGTCDCDAGFEGESCETYSRDKYKGTYTYTTTCNTQTQTSEITDHPDEAHPEWVSITNISADKDASGYAEISGDSIWIPSQTVTGSSGGKWVVVSTEAGVISGGTFTLKVNRKVAGTSGSGVACEHVFVVQ